jgi:hypothetical protein
LKEELGEISNENNILQNNIVNKLGKLGFSILKGANHSNQIKFILL